MTYLKFISSSFSFIRIPVWWRFRSFANTVIADCRRQMSRFFSPDNFSAYKVTEHGMTGLSVPADRRPRRLAGSRFPVRMLSGLLFGLLLNSGVFAATQCNTTVTAIPDNGNVNVSVTYQAGDVSSTIFDANLSLDITHTWVGDLESTITHPAGAVSVQAFDRPGVPASQFGCSFNDMQVIFDDEAASGTNIENICNGGAPAISGTYQPQNIGTNPLSDYDGLQPNGTWTFNVSDNATQDTGTIDSACVTIQHAAVTFDKWVSTNATCSDTLDVLNVTPGANVYYCYTVSNPGTEQLVLNPGNTTDDQGLDISGLEGTYAPGASNTVVLGPYTAGGAQLPLGTTVNIAQVTMTGDSVAFPNTQTLVTNETATVNVSTVPPASGIKNLYFGAPDDQNDPSQPQAMSRVPLTATPAVPRIRIRRQDTPRVWAQTPDTQASLSLSAGTTPVVLQLRRNNQTQTRNIRVTLDYVGAATGTLGFVDVNVPATGGSGLSNAVTRSFTFPVPTVAVTLPVGTQIRVIVDNSPTGGNWRAIFVYPYDGATGNTSQVQLNATTVINVDSVQFYDGAYPAGNAVPGVAPSQAVYVRAVISDPFGAFDITSATIAMTAGPCTIGSAAMTEIVALATASTKTFESVVVNTAVATPSTCTASVTGNEGSEGTVSHTNSANLLVGNPNLTVVKSATGISKPGQTLTFSIAVANAGNGYTNSVSMADIMSPYTAFGLTALPPSTAPFTLSDGAPCGTPSGITFGAPEYANDRPPTYAYAPGATGWDGAITAWRMQPMTGSMNPGSCFTMQYQAQVK